MQIAKPKTINPYNSPRTLVSWTVSFAVHAIVLILLLIIQLSIMPEIPEYSEMDFVSVPTVTSPALTQVPSAPTPAREEPPRVKPDEAPENLILPKMRHLPEEYPELIERKVEKITPTEKPFGGQVEPEATSVEREEKYPAVSSVGLEKKPTPEAQRLVVGKKPHAGSGEDADASSTRPYSIEGAASTRQVITEVLPEYPPGLNKEAVIKIRFTVLPNGSVGEMIPILKGDTTLEDITLKAFRQWRFNPLPPDAPQTPQSGVITFRYILK